MLFFIELKIVENLIDINDIHFGAVLQKIEYTCFDVFFVQQKLTYLFANKKYIWSLMQNKIHCQNLIGANLNAKSNIGSIE